MAFIKNKPTIRVGTWVYATRRLENFEGYFQIGTKVKVIYEDTMRGYDLEDEEGNKVSECGFDCVSTEDDEPFPQKTTKYWG